MVSLANCENILEREICNGYYAHLHIIRICVHERSTTEFKSSARK